MAQVCATHSLRAALVAALAVTLLGTLAPVAGAAPLSKETWLSGTTITEYYPVPESWFVGQRVNTPGLSRKSRVDWLYSARGVSMEGDGIGTDGKRYHIENSGSSGWITASGGAANFGGGIFAPFWRGEGYWRARNGRVTFPLETGGWYNGTGVKYVKPTNITFGAGPSRALSYYRSVAVDPSLIPLGSLVYVAAYKSKNKDGWFRADDTGGAIIGHHLDVYRPPPSRSSDQGGYLTGQRVFVVPKNRIAAYLKAHGGSVKRSGR